MRTCCLIISFVISVEHRTTLRRLHVSEGNRIVHLPFNSLCTQRTEIGNAQFIPIDVIHLIILLMLMTWEIDTIDAIGCVGKAFTFEYIRLPFAHLKILVRRNIDTKSVAFAVLPMSVIKATIVAIELSITIRNVLLTLTLVSAAFNTNTSWQLIDSCRMSLIVCVQRIHSPTLLQTSYHTNWSSFTLGLQEYATILLIYFQSVANSRFSLLRGWLNSIAILLSDAQLGRRSWHRVQHLYHPMKRIHLLHHFSMIFRNLVISVILNAVYTEIITHLVALRLQSIQLRIHLSNRLTNNILHAFTP